MKYFGIAMGIFFRKDEAWSQTQFFLFYIQRTFQFNHNLLESFIMKFVSFEDSLKQNH